MNSPTPGSFAGSFVGSFVACRLRKSSCRLPKARTRPRWTTELTPAGCGFVKDAVARTAVMVVVVIIFADAWGLPYFWTSDERLLSFWSEFNGFIESQIPRNDSGTSTPSRFSQQPIQRQMRSRIHSQTGEEWTSDHLPGSFGCRS